MKQVQVKTVRSRIAFLLAILAFAYQLSAQLVIEMDPSPDCHVEIMDDSLDSSSSDSPLSAAQHDHHLHRTHCCCAHNVLVHLASTQPIRLKWTRDPSLIPEADGHANGVKSDVLRPPIAV